MNQLTKVRLSAKRKTITALACLALAVALPTLCHLIGGALSLGGSLGAMLLPMHFTVLLLALTVGAVYALPVALLAPTLSHLLLGMPTAALLPSLLAECATLALCAGLLSERKLPTVGKLLLCRILGLAVRAGVVALSGAPVASVLSAAVTGIPGTLLSLCLIPMLLPALRGEADA